MLQLKSRVSPGNTALDVVPLLGQLLQLQDALGLDLKEGFVGWQPDVIHPFGVRNPQPGSLPTSQEQSCHFILGNTLKTWRATEHD